MKMNINGHIMKSHLIFCNINFNKQIKYLCDIHNWLNQLNGGEKVIPKLEWCSFNSNWMGSPVFSICWIFCCFSSFNLCAVKAVIHQMRFYLLSWLLWFYFDCPTYLRNLPRAISILFIKSTANVIRCKNEMPVSRVKFISSTCLVN